MNLKNIIPISSDVLINILIEEIKKIPGINEQDIKEVKLNDAACTIDVYIKPVNLIGNIYAQACEIQQSINYYLTRQFDIKEGQIKINVYLQGLDIKGDK